jgi:molybdopterin-guanine dinucleotide biosynthesis protein A
VHQCGVVPLRRLGELLLACPCIDKTESRRLQCQGYTNQMQSCLEKGTEVVHYGHAITGAILAGGQSSRMGQNKALMSLGGHRLIDRVVHVLEDIFAELLLVTNRPEIYADLGVRMVSDVFPEKGSLGGIYSAISHASTPYCFIVACDMPFLQAPVIRYLIEHIADHDVVIPDVYGEMQPLHAIYNKTCLAPIRQRLDANRLKIIGFLPDLRVRIVTRGEILPLDPALHTFQNLNTPEEFQAAEQHLRSSSCGGSNSVS